MKITLLMIGKTSQPQLVKLLEEYQNRLKHYVPIDVIVIPELKNTKSISENEQKEREGDFLLKQIEPADELYLLDENGKQYTSVEFAAFISKKQITLNKRMIFVIGGPYGFAPKVYQRANGLISLSKMTFSHQMIRVIFLEQLYRAMTIIKGEPYHHQ